MNNVRFLTRTETYGFIVIELTPTLYNYQDGSLTHFLADVKKYNYLQKHSCNKKTNYGFAFNEGWAHYCSGACKEKKWKTDYRYEGRKEVREKWREGWRARGRDGERKGGREGGREGGWEGGREGVEGGGGKEGEREGGRLGGREGGRELIG